MVLWFSRKTLTTISEKDGVGRDQQRCGWTQFWRLVFHLFRFGMYCKTCPVTSVFLTKLFECITTVINVLNILRQSLIAFPDWVIILLCSPVWLQTWGVWLSLPSAGSIGVHCPSSLQVEFWELFLLRSHLLTQGWDLSIQQLKPVCQWTLKWGLWSQKREWREKGALRRAVPSGVCTVVIIRGLHFMGSFWHMLKCLTFHRYLSFSSSIRCPWTPCLLKGTSSV